MLVRFITGAIMLALIGGTLAAQEDYLGFPESRVRMVRTESHVPDELYDQNRVIIRKTNIRPSGRGMQITGEVITDFDADRVPMGEDLPKGQLQGLKVDVELYYYDTVLERDATGAVMEPKIDAKNPGRLVEGQIKTVLVDDYLGNFGLARFELPVLDKPLAPGVYRLVARVRFKTQDKKLQAAIKWCGDMYGARAEVDPDTQEILWRQVMADSELHNEVYSFLVDSKGELADVSLLWIGEVLKDGNFELVPADKGNARKPANYLVWSYHLSVIDQVLAFENQLDNVDAVVDAELAAKLALEPKAGATQEEIDTLNGHKERWKKEAAEDKKRIRRDNGDLITKYGGRTVKTKELNEPKLHTSAIAARMTILEQIAELQEYLSLKYWILTDGFLTYTGWHQINLPAYQAWEAINKNDNKAAAIDRVTKNAAVVDAPGGLATKWENRKTQWRLCPPEMVKAAFDYLRTKEEKADFDPEKYTEKDGDIFVLKSDKWAEYRMEFITKFLEQSNKLLSEIDTSSIYAVQVWPQAFSQVKSARDDVITLSYSWEYYIRTEQMKEDPAVVKEAWLRETDSMPNLKLGDYTARATNAPGNIKNRFDSSLNLAKVAARVKDFTFKYARAIDEGKEAKFLPGRRPPTAPPEAK